MDRGIDLPHRRPLLLGAVVGRGSFFRRIHNGSLRRVGIKVDDVLGVGNASMRNDTSAKAIYDLIRARGVTVRDYSLVASGHDVRLSGEVRSYHQMQVCLSVVSSNFEGWNIVNSLVVHAVDSDDEQAPQPFAGVRTDILPECPSESFAESEL